MYGIITKQNGNTVNSTQDHSNFIINTVNIQKKDYHSRKKNLCNFKRNI